jgi:2'-5' RNA ligase
VPRLFVAVYPPPPVVRSLARLPHPETPGVRWVPVDQYHVTLRFLGDADVDEVRAAPDDVHLDGEPPQVRLGPQVSRLGRTVICVPAAGLDDLAASVVSATEHLGRPPEARRFHGHVTLARLKQRAACGLAGTPFSAEFTAEAIHLVESVTRAEGAEHHQRGTWSLET